MTKTRPLHRIAAAALLALGLPGAGLPGTAQAAAPQQHTQAPGYYRLRLGSIEVTALNDGVFTRDVAPLLMGITPAQVDAALARNFQHQPIDMSVNAFLVNTGSKLVLIDTGIGAAAGVSTGHLLASLRAAGHTPEEVDEIYITHMHPDHVGGLSDGGKAVFPNAVVRAGVAEGDYWLSAEQKSAAAEDRRGTFDAAMAALAPYRAAGRFRPITADGELVPGVRALAAPGHTPGHTVYVVESQGERLVLWGDLMHVAAVQFPDPSITIRFDSDPATAAARRRQVFAEVAAHGDWVGGAHLSFPGLGHLRANGSGYDFVPATYGLAR